MSDALLALVQFSDHDYAWLAHFFSLLFLPFAHEDLAIILCGYIVVNKIMPVGLVVACIYGGMVASDFALYGIGAGARRLPWLTRFAVDDRVRNFAEVLKRNLFGLVALCRVVPGAVFVAFVACGWARVPLGRFTVASFVVSALYLPLMLYLVIVSGDALDDRVGLWAWPMLLLVTVALGFIRWRVFTFQNASKQPAASAAGVPAPADNPAHRGLARKVALAERIPRVLFYLPLVASWICFGWRHRSLTLPTAVNPRMPTAGMWGDSKSNSLLDIAASERRWIADFVVMRRSAGPRTLYADLERVRQSLHDAGLTFPLVTKPDIGWRGLAVRRIDDVPALREYLRDFPGGAKLILQRSVPHPGEAAVLYARLPGAERGRILSLSFRHAPDELDRVPAREEVVQIAPAGHCGGRGQSVDARRYITPELEARFDAIAKGMSEFHYGRFDLRFSSTEELMRGEEFSIVGISGIGAEAIDAWDPNMPLAEVYRTLIDRQRILFLIGEKNRARGFEPMGCAEFLKGLIRRSQLVRHYPASA